MVFYFSYKTLKMKGLMAEGRSFFLKSSSVDPTGESLVT